jgi:hypothetical protein
MLYDYIVKHGATKHTVFDISRFHHCCYQTDKRERLGHPKVKWSIGHRGSLGMEVRDLYHMQGLDRHRPILSTI